MRKDSCVVRICTCVTAPC